MQLFVHSRNFVLCTVVSCPYPISVWQVLIGRWNASSRADCFKLGCKRGSMGAHGVSQAAALALRQLQDQLAAAYTDLAACQVFFCGLIRSPKTWEMYRACSG